MYLRTNRYFGHDVYARVHAALATKLCIFLYVSGVPPTLKKGN